jgi:hypothetical protein
MRFLTMVKSKEPWSQPPQALMDAIAKIGAEAFQSGKMVETGGLLPSAMGAKVRLQDGKITVTDGPFSEAKEVIGGYAIFELPSKKEAIEETVKFMQLHKDQWPGWEGETEVRPIFAAPDFAPPKKG